MMLFVLMQMQHVIDWFLIDAPTRQDRKIEKQREAEVRRKAREEANRLNAYANRTPEQEADDDMVFLANARAMYELGLPARDS